MLLSLTVTFALPCVSVQPLDTHGSENVTSNASTFDDLHDCMPQQWVQYESILIGAWLFASICTIAVCCEARLRERRAAAMRANKEMERSRSVELAVRRLPTCTACGEDECAICLCTLATGDELRELPCGHKFHFACIDRWLIRRELDYGASSCPICKKKVLTEEALQAAVAELSRAPPTRSGLWAIRSSRVAWRSAQQAPLGQPTAGPSVTTVTTVT